MTIVRCVAQIMWVCLGNTLRFSGLALLAVAVLSLCGAAFGHSFPVQVLEFALEYCSPALAGVVLLAGVALSALAVADIILRDAVY